MALRNIVTKEDPLLYKTSREVENFNIRLQQLLDDMKETLIKSGGVGLAAPQVGVLRRAALVIETNVQYGEEEPIIEFINPVIIETEGVQEGTEGCLSAPGEYGIVKRPARVKARAQNRYGAWFEYEGVGLTARCMCHEFDHLDGHLFLEKCDRMLTKEEIRESSEE